MTLSLKLPLPSSDVDDRSSEPEPVLPLEPLVPAAELVDLLVSPVDSFASDDDDDACVATTMPTMAPTTAHATTTPMMSSLRFLLDAAAVSAAAPRSSAMVVRREGPPLLLVSLAEANPRMKRPAKAAHVPPKRQLEKIASVVWVHCTDGREL